MKAILPAPYQLNFSSPSSESWGHGGPILLGPGEFYQPLFCKERVMEHPDPEVRAAIIKLSDALCSWERATSRESVLIVRETDFTYRAASGKPGIPEGVTDAQVMRNILGIGK